MVSNTIRHDANEHFVFCIWKESRAFAIYNFAASGFELWRYKLQTTAHPVPSAECLLPFGYHNFVTLDLTLLFQRSSRIFRHSSVPMTMVNIAGTCTNIYPGCIKRMVTLGCVPDDNPFVQTYAYENLAWVYLKSTTVTELANVVCGYYVTA